ncbi:hypothetical protein SOVF_019850 [Spinacia oleracea]|uniref:GDSL esterase/lipase At1g29660 n=1 Tax=Spinacia oleracea TaxID=3562 RepID=A0A9R0JYD7_SPIOL|nr:GDSL esterase/lipase At1g29660-like [Spinacia oleracea]KNA24007.1 hypothetical protein SOVF_019850 [Spinacia oleracea]
MMLRIVVLVLIIVCADLAKGESKVPCYFIFGDSLSDVGNNNDLRTLAKTNYPPYGVDFPGGIATGRFSNNRTIEDFITTFLGFNKSIAPYSAQINEDILRGVNFASGAAGILSNSGSQLGDRVWMDKQIRNYLITTSKLVLKVRGHVSDYLNKCLYTVNIGSNDYINNYFMPENYPSKRLYTPEQFANLLIVRFRSQLQALYNTGARKVAVFGLGLIGCTPAQIAMRNATQCIDEINQAANLFNEKLPSLIDDFNRLPMAKFTLISLTAMQALNPLPPGIITTSTCCQLRSDFQCEPFTPPCANRNIYAFFDGYHPTDVVNGGVAESAYNTPNRMIANPMNINELSSS